LCSIVITVTGRLLAGLSLSIPHHVCSAKD